MKKIVVAIFLVVFVLVSLTAGATKESSENLVAVDQESSEMPPSGYPKGVVSFVVPAAAGAANDLVTRAVTDCISIGGNTVVENIVGASQTIGSIEVALRPSNGQSILTCANVGMILAPITMDLPYSPNDFRHIAMMTSPITMTICVKAGGKIDSAEKWVDLVKSADYFTYSHPAGAGGLGHIAASDFLSQLNSSNGQFIAYDGNTAVIQALLNGEIDWAILDVSDAVTQQASGTLLPLFIIAEEADEHTASVLPGVPCLSSIGIKNMEYYVGLKWFAVKKDTPDQIVEWIKKCLNSAIASEKYQTWLVNAGYGTCRYYSEEEITDLVMTSYNLSKDLMEKLNLVN